MNIFKSIFKGVEEVVEAPVSAVKKVKTIFEQVTTDTPELRDALVGMVGKLEAVSGDIAVDVSADGINVAADLKTLQDTSAAVTYFRATVLPLIDQIYGQVKTDTGATAPAPAAAAPAATVKQTVGVAAGIPATGEVLTAQTGTGLHLSVAADKGPLAVS